MAASISVLGQVKGGKELRARMKAIAGVFKPYARKWANEAVSIGKPLARGSTGETARSIRVKSVTQAKAVVGGKFTAYFIDAGAKYPSKSRKRRNTIFHPKSGFRMKPRPFRARMAHEALRRIPPRDEVIRAWNEAA